MTNSTSGTIQITESSKPVNGSEISWPEAVVVEACNAACTTIGLMAGSRDANDVRVIDSLVKELSDQFGAREYAARMMLLRLDVHHSTSLERQHGQPAGLPKSTRSPLGNWSEVAVPMPVGRSASWSLQQLPRWLPKWKSEFDLILIDLGPMNLVPSRAIGRLCDSCYLLLGPDSCASHEWILQHVAWHDRSGSSICGTLLTTYRQAG